MMAPSSDSLPSIRAWAPSDARLSWRYKEDKDHPEKSAFVVTGFGGELKSSTWIDPASGEVSAEKKRNLLERILGKGGSKPRVAPSSADPSVLAGAQLTSEEDVLYMRHLPDFGGALRAGDVEYMLQVPSSRSTCAFHSLT